MAMTNHQRVGKGLELLKDGLRPFVERELERRYGKYWVTQVTARWSHDVEWTDDNEPHLDTAVLLRMMWEQWNEVFRDTLGHAERSLVSELRDVRNRWAHQNRFSSNDAWRALDSMARLLTAVSAPQSADVDEMRKEAVRVWMDDQVRSEQRRTAAAPLRTDVTAGLKPWREVVTPHPDVASGRYQEADFAADLWQVHLGDGPAEYKDPVEFFRRTFLTESLTRLLAGGVRRLSGKGGDPVIQLQTNFGGGKTHTMLALYHLFSGADIKELVGLEEVLKQADTTELPSVRRVVLVGNKIPPGSPSFKEDGTPVNTLWGELAWQLGGREAYERIRLDDERGTSPGDALRALFNDYGPSLILIDEWVAYARQLHDNGQLPAGSFETQFSFAQALTESAKLADRCLLVISLPASETGTNAHSQADDTEVGGRRGREALHRLQNVIGRVESSWRPASTEESFEIVRRRLFQPLIHHEQFVARDTVARAFHELYSTQAHEFPPECREAEYERRIQAAYPIHPEIFDRLYTDWSTMRNFQRTRGVLRLMAAVIHSLWESGDRSPLILPANIPIEDPRVQDQFVRSLTGHWAPVIEKDVDGPNSLPMKIDSLGTNLGKYGATRRVARTIFLGSAPIHTVANRGLEDRRIHLGSVMPGETPAVFGDALRRLSTSATYLYHDGTRYWYSTQPTALKLAEDRAEQLRRDPDAVGAELRRRIDANVRGQSAFARVHVFPGSTQDVPDDVETRLVIFGMDAPHSREANTPAEALARKYLGERGTSPRLYKNTLVFLAPDKTRLEELDQALRMYLAWKSIIDEKEELNLAPYDVRQAETQLSAAQAAVEARIPEAFPWLLIPTQEDPSSDIVLNALRLQGREPLAERAARRLRNDENLVFVLAGTLLRYELDTIPLWRGDHVPVRQLVDDFARYPYLPRLATPEVLVEAIRSGVSLQTWETDAFAYADSFDESAGRYRGLRAGKDVHVSGSDPQGLLVRSDVARRQMDEERRRAREGQEGLSAASGSSPGVPGSDAGGYGEGGLFVGGPGEPTTSVDGLPSPDSRVGRPGADGQPSADVSGTPLGPTRFYGSVALSPTRAGRDAARIAEEVIAHLAGLTGADVRITLEIDVNVPDGVPEHVVRIVTENARTLRFETQGFERE